MTILSRQRLGTQINRKRSLSHAPLRPAACPDDCRVGPTQDELSSSTFVSWGHDRSHSREIQSEKKRQRPGNDKSNIQQTTCIGERSSFQHAIDTFLSSGCCVIDQDVLPPEFVTKCLDRAKEDYWHLEELLRREKDDVLHPSDSLEWKDSQRHHRMAAFTRQDYSEWVARDGGRVDIRYKLNEYPYNCGGLVYNSLVFPLVKALLNGRENDDQQPVQLLYAGVMWGMPVGSKAASSNTGTDTSCLHQKWHADGGHLFEPCQLPEGLTLPPHCINVFYPLVDLTQENGPTEFKIGSHRRDRDNFSAGAEFPLLCPAGGAVLFDYRIQHRGRANLAVAEPSSNNLKTNLQKGRPVLYLAYAKTYFKDHGNTRSGRKLDPESTSSGWTTRTLEGKALPLGKGFDAYTSATVPTGTDSTDRHGKNKRSTTSTTNNSVTADPTTTATSEAVGERWVLFQMTLELPNGNSDILKVYKGDIPCEVAQQFCFRHELQDDFVQVLTDTIQTQIQECCGGE